MLDSENAAMVDRHADSAPLTWHMELPREVVTDPERLVDTLRRAALDHGLTPDERESTRRALLLTARTLQQILLPAGSEPTRRRLCMDCKDDQDPGHPGLCLSSETCTCSCNRRPVPYPLAEVAGLDGDDQPGSGVL